MSGPRPGQVWVCAAQGSAPPLLCIVGRIDAEAEGRDVIVSLAVAPHPEARKAGWPKVAHLPIRESAFLGSGLHLAREGVEPGPDFADGHALWRSRYEAGEAGVFDLPVPEAYEAVVAILREGTPPAPGS